ncbi:MAG: RNA polymerase-associated protein RapA [Verrucomicrobiota bacterium]
MPDNFHPGQRWISESEPELGLGSVRRVTLRTVTIGFEASDETREYARDNAPLRRVRFRVGDSITCQAGATRIVESVAERAGLIFYRGGGKELCETELSDVISFNKPEERLLAGQLDPTEVFDLRVAALGHQHRRRKSKVRGFVGGRIELIPHQLYIAAEVAGRLVPRVLLADEVGLGKTIEACLILHRLILTGRAQRVLILVPESLVHQWFVELLRRFNLWFHIFDEERCDAIETADPETNPFLDDQLVLASIRLFTGKEKRVQQALAAGWDMLVVDEAHHLGWSAQSVSPEYAVIEALGRQTPGLVLLTATPEQLGMASHFARLRLLDPDRFYDLNEFIHEAESYRDVARLAEKILGNHQLAASEVARLARILADTETNVRSKLEQIARGVGGIREELMDALLDQHGTGRVMFRNTRATISGFPKRIARLCPLPAPAGDMILFDALAKEFDVDVRSSLRRRRGNESQTKTILETPHVVAYDFEEASAGSDAKALTTFAPDFSKDIRIDWLADLLRSLEPDKVLLICRTQRKVEAIDVALRQRLNVKQAVFHEGLSLVQRDRNAAWFAEEDGARILICSEIGSEGRNFQFAHQLVLFDLPLDPELLEQRIGRLDRIGQTSEIQVHVPFVAGSPQEVLARWYHAGLNSFEKNLHGGHELLERFGARVHDLAQDFHETEATSRPELDHLIAETQNARKELTARLEQGRDRLLELNSFRPEAGATIVQEIRQPDADPALDEFMTAVFDHYAIHVEELMPRTYQLGSAGVFAESFPGLPTQGLTVTGDRQRALAREDVQFLTWDHPLVTGALDLLLGSEKGNSSFAKWPDAKTAGIYVETIYLLECIAPPPLHVDRFLPPTPVRVLVDHRAQEVGNSIPPAMLARNLKNGDGYALLERSELREELLPNLIAHAQAFANGRAGGFITQARKEMTAQLDHEIVRLKELQKVNRSVRAEEIELLVHQQRALDQHLTGARLRLDAIRLIQRGPG